MAVREWLRWHQGTIGYALLTAGVLLALVLQWREERHNCRQIESLKTQTRAGLIDDDMQIDSPNVRAQFNITDEQATKYHQATARKLERYKPLPC